MSLGGDLSGPRRVWHGLGRVVPPSGSVGQTKGSAKKGPSKITLEAQIGRHESKSGSFVAGPLLQNIREGGLKEGMTRGEEERNAYTARMQG